jgi:hypothetical protein
MQVDSEQTRVIQKLALMKGGILVLAGWIVASASETHNTIRFFKPAEEQKSI